MPDCQDTNICLTLPDSLTISFPPLFLYSCPVRWVPHCLLQMHSTKLAWPLHTGVLPWVCHVLKQGDHCSVALVIEFQAGAMSESQFNQLGYYYGLLNYALPRCYTFVCLIAALAVSQELLTVTIQSQFNQSLALRLAIAAKPHLFALWWILQRCIWSF